MSNCYHNISGAVIHREGHGTSMCCSCREINALWDLWLLAWDKSLFKCTCCQTDLRQRHCCLSPLWFPVGWPQITGFMPARSNSIISADGRIPDVVKKQVVLFMFFMKKQMRPNEKKTSTRECHLVAGFSLSWKEKKKPSSQDGAGPFGPLSLNLKVKRRNGNQTGLESKHGHLGEGQKWALTCEERM